MTEMPIFERYAELLEAEFGPHDDDGIYGAPPAAPDPPGRAPAGAAPGGP